MNIQEQEENNYQMGMNSNSLQDCLEESILSLEVDDSEKIKKAIKEGKFVLYFGNNEYCSHTDAFLRFHKKIIKICETLKDAEDISQKYKNYKSEDSDVYIESKVRENFCKKEIDEKFKDVPF